MLSRRGLLLLALLLAFLLRVWGLSFGLPFELHPDEHQYIDPALAWHQTGELHTGTVNPPLFVYVLLVAFRGWLWLSPFEDSATWVTATVTFARLWSAAFGLLTVALAFPAGRRLHGRQTGLLATLLLAGLFLPARESHFAVNDTATAFFALLSLYFSLGVMRRRTWANYLGAGIAAGLATAAKLTGGVVLIALPLAHWLACAGERPPLRRLWQRQLWAGLAASVITFGLLALPLLRELPRLFDSIANHLQFGSEGYKGLQMAPAGGWLYYLSVLSWAVGWLLLALSLIGLGWLLLRRYHPGYVLAIFPVALFAYMGAQKILFARFLLPAVPPLVLLAALALVWGTQRSTFFQRRQRGLWPLLLAVLLMQPLATLLRFNHLLTRPDTRQLASDWLADNFPADTVLVKESYAVFPPQLLRTANWPFKTIQLDERGPTRNAIDYYVSHKTNLIAISNFTYGRVRQDPAEESARQQQLAYLDAQAELLQTFNPYRTEPGWFYLDELYGPAGETWQRVQPGPLLKIYRLPYENQPHTSEMPAIPQPLNANFGDELLLLGYDLPQRRADPGGSLPLTLYWQAIDRPAATYVIFNRLLDTDQQPWGGYDRWPQETANTRLWHPGEVVVDAFALPVAPDAPAGVYTIDLGLYDQADAAGRPLPLLRDGAPVGQNSVRLGPVKIGGSPADIAPVTISPQQPLAVELGQPPVIALRGYDLNQSPTALELRLYWASLAQTPVDWSVFVHVRDEAGQIVAQKDGPVGSGTYPSALWDAGDSIRDSLTVPLPDNLPPGRYQVVIGLYNLADGTRLAVPGSAENALLLTDLQVTQP